MLAIQVVAKELKQLDCYPVFLGKHLKERYYKGATSHCRDCAALMSELGCTSGLQDTLLYDAVRRSVNVVSHDALTPI